MKKNEIVLFETADNEAIPTDLITRFSVLQIFWIPTNASGFLYEMITIMLSH